jgi:hypothetical protein
MVAEEQSIGVLQGLLQGPIASLLPERPERVVAWVMEISARVAGRSESKKVRSACADTLARVYLWKENNEAKEAVLNIVDHPAEHLDEASSLIHLLRNVVVLGPTDGSEPDTDRARQRGLDLLLRITRGAKKAFHAAVEAARDPEANGPALQLSQEDLRSLAHILDGVGSNLYFESGAYTSGNRKPLSEDVQTRLLREAGPIIDELAEVGLAGLAHHLFETLEVMVPYDPRSVFLQIAAVIRGGRRSGYQHDPMAERVLVRVVERYLADYRAIFQDDEELRRALVDVLDTFVGAGSLGAQRLSYGLAEIFR